MPRPLRLQDAGYLHHVISRGNDSQVLFRDDEDRKKYISLLDLSRKEYPVYIYNYCLMPTHVQLLVEPKEDGSLSKAMQMVSKEYAKYFNKKYERSGHVFEGRFKNFVIQPERYFFTSSRYMDLRPMKEGLVKDAKDYLWSGYKAWTSGSAGILKLDVHKLYKDLGNNDQERQIGYRTLVLNYQGEDVDLMEKHTGILGDAAFKKTVRSKKQEERSKK